MKKALAMLLCLVMVLGLFAGCGGNAAESAAAESSAPAESVAAAPEAEEAPEEAPAEEASAAEEASVVEEAPVEKGEFEPASATNLPLADGEVLTYFTELPGYMSMFNVNSYDDIEAHKEAEKITGVDIEFTIVNNESLETNFQLMVASGDITDLVSGGTQQYDSSSAMIEDGVAIDLMEYTDLLPNYMYALDYYDQYKTMAINMEGQMPEVISMSDGYGVTSGLQVRQDWLEEQGMELPTTLEGVHEMLLMFVSEYGADHALLMQGAPQMMGNSFVGGMGSIGYSGDGVNMYVKDGVVQNGFRDEAYKEYMQMMAQWYEEGILNPGFATESSDPWTSNADAYIAGGNTGLWSAQSDNIDKNVTTGLETDDNYAICALAEPTVDGEKFHFGDSTIGTNAMGKNISISDCCENIELACAYLDYYYTKEGILLANYGIEGVSLGYDDNGDPMLTDTVLKNPDFPMISFATTYYTLACAATVGDYDKMYPAYSEANLAAIETYTNSVDDLYTLPPAMELTYDESTEFAEIWSDLSTYASTEVFKFIMGEYNFEADWDNFIAQVEDMGLQDCIDIYQDAYDRYVAVHGE